MEQKVKNTLDAVSFVCTTADMWKAHNLSFFGATIHWIDTNKLEHCKAAISWLDITSMMSWYQNLNQSIAATTLLAKLLLLSQRSLSRPLIKNV